MPGTEASSASSRKWSCDSLRSPQSLERTARVFAAFGLSAWRCVVLNEKLLEVMGDDVTQEQAFAHANDVLKNAVGGISDIIHIPGLVNVDFEDVKTDRKSTRLNSSHG